MQINPDLIKNAYLVGETVLTQPSQIMSVDNLHLKYGKSYKIIVSEYSMTDSSSGHYLLLNNNYNSYLGHHWYTRGNNSSVIVGQHTVGLGLVNGWNQKSGLFFTDATLTLFNQDWIGYTQLSTSITTTSTGNQHSAVMCFGNTDMNKFPKGEINSIQIISTNEDFIGIGSYIQVYELN